MPLSESVPNICRCVCVYVCVRVCVCRKEYYYAKRQRYMTKAEWRLTKRGEKKNTHTQLRTRFIVRQFSFDQAVRFLTLDLHTSVVLFFSLFLFLLLLLCVSFVARGSLQHKMKKTVQAAREKKNSSKRYYYHSRKHSRLAHGKNGNTTRLDIMSKSSKKKKQGRACLSKACNVAGCKITCYHTMQLHIKRKKK